MENKHDLDNFEQSFCSNLSTCRHTCACGVAYYHDDEMTDWEPGELEELKRSANEVPAHIRLLRFEGREYSDVCDCWHKRADTIIGFLKTYQRQIAKFLTLEKQRLQRIADDAPTIE